jgi:general secretion pathway protein G
MKAKRMTPASIPKRVFSVTRVQEKIRRWRRSRTVRVLGFTLVEMLIVVAIMSTLAAIAIYHYSAFIENTKVVRAESDIKTIAGQIDEYLQLNGTYPESLDELVGGPFMDPWGNPYEYVNISTAHHKLWRRDRNNKPINTYYDLWSNGPDGKHQKQVNGAKSRDDVIRAWDGLFIGLGGELDDLYGKPRKWKHPTDDSGD